MSTLQSLRPAGRPIALTSIEGNTQRLDGGAMFGNAPREVWSRWIAPDERHRIPLACRAMLVREDTGRLVLFETGIGAFFEPRMRDRFGVIEDRHVLLDNLAALSIAPSDIDLIVLSHLHFDHAGGLLSAHREGQPHSLAFPNARYVIGRAAWERAEQPHARDRASFIPELLPLLSTREVELVDASPASSKHLPTGHSTLLGDHYTLHFSEGHTPGLMLAEVHGARPVLFAGDLIPGVPWVHLPITMGYDRFPECLIDEKAMLLSDLLSRHGAIFFTHDPSVSLAKLVQTQGRFGVADAMGMGADVPLT